MEPSSPQASRGVIAARQQAATVQGAKTNEACCDARQFAIHVHYGIRLCEPFLCEIRAKFTTTVDSHVCWHVAVNVNFVRISREFNEHFFNFAPGAFVPWNHDSGGL